MFTGRTRGGCLKCQQTRSVQLAVRVLYGFFAFIVIALAVLAFLGELKLFWLRFCDFEIHLHSSSVITPTYPENPRHKVERHSSQVHLWAQHINWFTLRENLAQPLHLPTCFWEVGWNWRLRKPTRTWEEYAELCNDRNPSSGSNQLQVSYHQSVHQCITISLCLISLHAQLLVQWNY